MVIEDLRGDGDHYACRVVSTAFAGKSRVQQHQMVYKALGGRMGGELHALALQTSAPHRTEFFIEPDPPGHRPAAPLRRQDHA